MGCNGSPQIRALVVFALTSCLACCLSCAGGQNNGVSAQPITPTIAWNTPAAITYGTALSAAQLNATAGVPGTFTYTPGAGAVLRGGLQTLSTSFVPADTHAYTTATASVTLQVNRAAPAISWPTPAPIPVGTALSTAQLNATVKGVDGNNLAGTLIYSPPAGTVESAAGNISLSVSFTPSDSVDYTAGATSVTLVVLPDAKYHWQNVKIVDGGVMPGIYLHPAAPGLMYIRANVGGAYRWDPDTRFWVPITDWIGGASTADWNLMGVESIALDPTDPDRVYLAAGSYLASWWPNNGAMLISTDRGATFRRVDLPFKLGANEMFGQQGGERLAVNPFKPVELYLGTHANGLWQSEDRGATWTQVTAFPIASSSDQIGVGFVRFDPQHSGVAYVGTYSRGIYRTTDGGITWQQVPGQPALLPDGETLRPMRSALGPDGVFYVTYANSAGLTSISNGAVYKLEPASGIWTNITPPETSANLWYGYCAVAADARHSGTVMVGTWNRWVPGDDIYRSTDGGKTWKSLRQYSVFDTSLSPFLQQQAVFGIWNSSFEIDPFDSNHALYQGGNTVWATDELTNLDSLLPVHWSVGANGIEETVVHQVVSPPAGAHLLSALADEGGFRHDDFGVSPVPFLNPMMIEVAALDFAESNPALVARVGLLDYTGNIAGAYSTDGGVTWTRSAATPPGAGLGPTADGYAATAAVSADGQRFVWAPPDTVPAYSSNRGNSWISSTGAPVALRVVSDRVNPNKFYGYDASSGAFYASTDGGITFAKRITGLPQDQGIPGWTSEAQPRTVAGREGDIWLPLGSGLYHSTDSGSNFTKLSTISRASLVGFGMAPVSGDYPAVFAVGTVAGVYGIFRSDDAGASWIRINDDAHQFGSIGAISGDPRIFGRVYLGTQGRGIIYGDPVP